MYALIDFFVSSDDVALCGDSIGRLNEMIKTLETTQKNGA